MTVDEVRFSSESNKVTLGDVGYFCSEHSGRVGDWDSEVFGCFKVDVINPNSPFDGSFKVALLAGFKHLAGCWVVANNPSVKLR